MICVAAAQIRIIIEMNDVEKEKKQQTSNNCLFDYLVLIM